MEKYSVTEIRKQNFTEHIETVKRVQLKDKSKMEPDELVKIFNTITKQAEKRGGNTKIFVRVSTGNGFITFTDPEKLLNSSDYWEGKVKSESKFNDFYFADFYISKDRT